MTQPGGKRAGKPGDFFFVSLPEGRYGFGRVLKRPLVAFYDFASTSIPPVDELARKPIAFTIWVMRSAFSSLGWRLIERSVLPGGDAVTVPMFKRDPITKALFIHRDGVDTPATIAQCHGLERAAVWSRNHVEDRLVDHFAGRPNKWTEAMRPDR